MRDTRLDATIGGINEATECERMKAHVMLVIISLLFIGLGIQFGQIWLWMPFLALGGFSALRFIDHRARWKAWDRWKRELAQQMPSEPVRRAERPGQGDQSASGWPETGGFRPPKRGEPR